MIQTARLRLRRSQDADRNAFAEMNADPEVMHDLGGPISREASDAKLYRYAASFDRHDLGRWVIEDRAGDLLGYAGIMPSPADHPLGPHLEIGWRLIRKAWGHGYATEAAQAALKDGFTRLGLNEVLAYTAPENVRSQAVMSRLNLRRDPLRDFRGHYEGVGSWNGLVWAACPS